MGQLTQKEWCCLNEYVKDLLGEMRHNGDLKICDGCEEYTIQELVTLEQKILDKMNIFANVS